MQAISLGVCYEGGLDENGKAAFAPYANTTRAQIAVIFYRMEGSPAVEGENSFADVVRGSGTAWFYDAVTWAQQNGIMGGYDNSSFAPNDPITREQLAAIFYRYAQYKGYDTTQGGMAIREFDDYESISDYAMGAMAWAVNRATAISFIRMALLRVPRLRRCSTASLKTE